MAWKNPAYQEAQRRRWTRHDAWRWIPGASIAWTIAAAKLSTQADHEAREWLEIQSEISLLRNQSAKLRALRGSRKYNPGQPRVPAGHDGAGRWTDSDSFVSRMIRAGIPRVPRHRPPTSGDRSAAMRSAAEWLVANKGKLANLLVHSPWIAAVTPYVVSYLDRPKTLAELQRAVKDKKRGYDVHHIVEKTSAAADGYPWSRINRADNLARVPTMKHWQINAWYQTKNSDYGDVSPREYLRQKDWEERRRVELRALRHVGVLK